MALNGSRWRGICGVRPCVVGCLVASLSASARAERTTGESWRGPWASAAAPSENSSAAQLHALGDEHYANRRFTPAREAWLGAYALVPAEPESLVYRTTLLSLITSATLEAYAIEGEIEYVEEAIDLLKEFLEAEPELAPELHVVVADDLRRLQPVLDRASSRAVSGEGEGDVEDPDVEGTERSSPPEDNGRSKAGIALLTSGVVTLLAGGAAVVAGTQFRPRAQRQLDEVDDPAARERAFLEQERDKGRAWIGAGGGVAAVGVGLVIAGAVLIRRHRAAPAPAVSMTVTTSASGWMIGARGRF